MNTPRTDAKVELLADRSLDVFEREDELKDFARQLERELEEARLKAADRYEWQDVALKVSKERDRLQSQLTSAKSALERARAHVLELDFHEALTAINEVLK